MDETIGGILSWKGSWEKKKRHAEACLFLVGEAGLEPARPQ